MDRVKALYLLYVQQQKWKKKTTFSSKATKLFHLLSISGIILTSEPGEWLRNYTMCLHSSKTVVSAYCVEKTASLAKPKHCWCQPQSFLYFFILNIQVHEQLVVVK